MDRFNGQGGPRHPVPTTCGGTRSPATWRQALCPRSLREVLAPFPHSRNRHLSGDWTFPGSCIAVIALTHTVHTSSGKPTPAKLHDENERCRIIIFCLLCVRDCTCSSSLQSRYSPFTLNICLGAFDHHMCSFRGSLLLLFPRHVSLEASTVL